MNNTKRRVSCPQLTKLTLILTLLLGWGSQAWGDAKELPYSYGFEDNNLATDGWTKVGDNVSTNTAISKLGSYGVVVNSGDYSFRFNANSSPYQPQYLISPQLNNSATGIDVSFYYNNNGSSDGETFCVGYSTNTSAVGDFTWDDVTTVNKGSGWILHSTSFPTGTKYIAIKYTSQNKNKIFIDDVSIEPSETYKRPKNLTVNSYTTSSAILSWTNGRKETAWQMAYSTKEDFDPDTEGVKVAVTENPYTLSGLTDGVTYYAYVRSNYSGNYSAWCNDKVEFTPRVVLLVNEGGNTSTYAPIHNNTNYGTVGQFIIPAASLESIQNRQITNIVLYTKESDISWSGVTFDVYLDMPENSTYTSTSVTLKDWGTKVCSSKTLSVSKGIMNIELDSPYSYSTGNLLIGLQENGKTASSVTSTWYGVNEATNYTSAYTYKYSDAGTLYYGSAKFSPKVTIETKSSSVPVTLGENGYTTFACPRPLDLASLPTGLNAYKAAVDAKNAKVRFTEINEAVAANTGMLLEGTAGETYNIPVATSGSNISASNDFLVNSMGGTFDAESGYTYFGFKKDSDPLVFATFAPGTVAIPTNKAYLKVKTSELPAESRALALVFDDETTGIANVKGKTEDVMYFDLQGRRISKPTKGLYIVNGKKTIVR